MISVNDRAWICYLASSRKSPLIFNTKLSLIIPDSNTYCYVTIYACTVLAIATWSETPRNTLQSCEHDNSTTRQLFGLADVCISWS